MSDEPAVRIDPGLKEWATDVQCEFIDYMNAGHNVMETGKHFNTSHQNVSSQLKRLRARAAKQGYSPEHDMTRAVPDPFVVRGVSTYYNKDGKPSGQWVKSKLDDARVELAMREAIAAMSETIPRVSPMFPPQPGNANLCNCYVITDYHMGMLSWGEETGADWDIKIAEDMLIKWFSQAIVQAPAADHAVFAQLSDFLHFDGLDAVTPASKHLLDVDSRFAKLVHTAIRVLRTIIDMLLAKYPKLHIIMADANHDPVSQIWLRAWFSAMYENEPRITVDTSPSPYNAYEFGKVALFFHHGHKRKPSEVSEVFVSQFREMFGRTKYAYAHMGHMHHLDVKENNMMIVEQHRTLAAGDAYSTRLGFRTGRDAKVITYHKDFGEVSRVIINSDMLLQGEKNGQDYKPTSYGV